MTILRTITIVPESWIIEETMRRIRRKREKEREQPGLIIPGEEHEPLSRNHDLHDQPEKAPESRVIIIEL